MCPRGYSLKEMPGFVLKLKRSGFINREKPPDLLQEKHRLTTYSSGIRHGQLYHSGQQACISNPTDSSVVRTTSRTEYASRFTDFFILSFPTGLAKERVKVGVHFTASSAFPNLFVCFSMFFSWLHCARFCHKTDSSPQSIYAKRAMTSFTFITY